jgi:outer membrane receptor protein involved in Fe transport
MSAPRGLFLWALLIAVCASGFAQETIHFASLGGSVSDATGAMISGATVSARQTTTNIDKVSITDQQGRFRFAYLPIGKYEVKVHSPGFADVSRTLTLTVGGAFDISMKLGVTATESTVQVVDDLPVLETARSQIATTLSQQEINSVPLNGRSFLDLALLIPGVSPTNTASTQLFPETSAVPGQGISINSQRNFSNSFVLDGLSANDDAAGLVGTFYSLGAIQEMQAVTSGGQAEFGRALGGYVSMVTKSGTNTVHGDLYGYLKNQRLNAENPLSGNKLPLTQGQFGASVGGPIVRNRTFYFANYEQRILNQDGLITIAQPNVDAINTRLAAVGYAGPAIATGLYPNPVHNLNFLGKVDHAFTQNDNFSARYSLYRVASSNSRSTGALSAVSAGSGLENTDQTIAVSNIYAISPRTVNETRGQFTNSDLKAPVNDLIGPAVNISGVASFGTASGSPTARYGRQFEIVDNISHQLGNHSIRVGTAFLYNDVKITYPRSIRGSYTFSSLANFQNGVYSTYTQTFGDPVISQTNPSVGFYVQDEWRIRPTLTVNAGLRYDQQFLDTIATDTNNVSPRLGFAWSVTPHTVVRASGGLFYDRVPLRPLANALLSADNTTDLSLIQQQSVSVAFGQVGAPIFPNILATVPSNVLIGLTTMNRDLQNAYSVQAGLEIERQLTRSATVNVNYQHLRGKHLLLSINQNVPACSAAVDRVNLCRPNPNFQNNSQYSAAADSAYDALNVSYVQRPSRLGGFRVSYTFAKALADVGEFFFSSPINQFNVQQDWGRSDDDQRHRVVFDGYIQSPTGAAHTAWQHLTHGFQLGAVLQYYSALPLNVVSGVNTIQQTSGRPCFGLAATSPGCGLSSMIGRNSGTGFDYFNVSARLSRVIPVGERVRIQAMAEAFNLLNHRNDLIPNATFGTGVYPDAPRSTFGQPTAVADPRAIQLALRITY